MITNDSTRYGALSKSLHWLMALLIIALLAVGWYMTSLPDDAPGRLRIINTHKAIGALVLLLALIRIVWIRMSPAPALPAVFSDKERKLTKALQGLLYLLMILMPVSGYVMSTAAGYPVHFFGLFDLPMLFGKSKALAGAMGEAHEFMAWTLAAIVLLHMAGAIKHRLLDRGGESDILRRML